MDITRQKPLMTPEEVDAHIDQLVNRIRNSGGFRFTPPIDKKIEHTIRWVNGLRSMFKQKK